jgi:hypothetical protein
VSWARKKPVEEPSLRVGADRVAQRGLQLDGGAAEGDLGRPGGAGRRGQGRAGEAAEPAEVEPHPGEAQPAGLEDADRHQALGVEVAAEVKPPPGPADHLAVVRGAEVKIRSARPSTKTSTRRSKGSGRSAPTNQ